MGYLLGMMAGIFMIALIVFLLLKFISDLGVTYNKEIVQSVKKYSLWGLAFFAATYIVGGVTYTFNNPDGFQEERYLFELENVWDFAIFTNYKGIPSLFNLLKDGFAKILFDQTYQCAFYISLICAMITCASIGIVLTRMVEKKAAERSFLLVMCLPFAYYIFLPAPFAMFIAMYAMFMALIVCEKEKWAVIPALIACVTHINGLMLLILWLIFKYVRKEKHYMKIIVSAVVTLYQIALVIVYFVIGWSSLEEIVFTAMISLVMLISDAKWIIGNNMYKIVLMTSVIVSGFFMCRNIFCVTPW